MKYLSLSTAFLLLVFSYSHAEDSAAKSPVKMEVVQKQLAGGTQLLDVRTEEEWKEGHLKDAKRVTVTEDGFLEKATALLDKKKPVVVYCRSGKRSAMAAEQLRTAGYTVYDMEGGITAWIAAGKEVVKPDAKSGAVQKSTASDEEIKKLKSEIEASKQDIDNLEAFVVMERAKLEEDPNYDSSFLEEALNEQQGIREKVEEVEGRLKEISK